MSDDLYSTRLRFTDGRGGVAKRHGRLAPISAAPDLGAGPVHAVDYVPEIGMRQVRRRACDPIDDLTDDEVARADALLREAVPTIPGAL